MKTLTFENRESSFFESIKTRVEQYFNEKGLERSGNWRLYTKSSIQTALAIGIYVILVFFTPSPAWLSAALCVLLGLNLSVLGFNIMHEGGHQSFSSIGWLNSTASYFLNALGGNIHFWKVKHNINHHTWTNIDGADSDIDVRPFMRLHRDQPLHRMHRYQHFYWVILYGVSYVVWVFYEDFLKYFTSRINQQMAAKKLAAKEHIIFWITKVSYVFFYLALPIIMCGWVQALVGFAIVTFVCGLAISIVFQLAHVVEGTAFPVADLKANKIHEEWAVHQVSTTSNFGTRSKILFWLLGGLNFQVEHHLFPRVSHIHYPMISKIVRDVCKEYNIRYNEYKTMAGAIRSHLAYLKRLGTTA